MTLFEIKNFSARVLFSGKFGSLKLCMEAAVSAGADLAGANLAGAYLAGAYLARANLARADLAGANLAGAYLAGANLARADLAGANLAGADLAGADLAGAKLTPEIELKRAPIQILGLTYPVSIFDDHMQIGCELHSIAEWTNFSDRRIAEMDRCRSFKFWARHRDALLALAASDGRPALTDRECVEGR